MYVAGGKEGVFLIAHLCIISGMSQTSRYDIPWDKCALPTCTWVQRRPMLFQKVWLVDWAGGGSNICSRGTVCVCAYPLSDVQHQFEIRTGGRYHILHALFLHLHLSVSCVVSNTTIAQLRPVVITTQQLVCDVTALGCSISIMTSSDAIPVCFITIIFGHICQQ